MNYYVTKYALTKGIWVVFADDAEEVNGYLYVGRKGALRTQCIPGTWFRTLEEAEARTAELVAAKIRSLEKTKKKLENYKPRVTNWR